MLVHPLGVLSKNLPLTVGRLFTDSWFHPFGPLTKNLPILAGTYVLIQRLGTQDPR